MIKKRRNKMAIRMDSSINKNIKNFKTKFKTYVKNLVIK